MALAAGTCGVAAIVAVPADRTDIEADSASAWLPSVQRGGVLRVNAFIPAPHTATTDMIGARVPADVITGRRDHHLVLSGVGTGRATVVDLRTLRPTDVTTSDTQVVDVLGDRIVRIDTGNGRVEHVRDHDSVDVVRIGGPVGRSVVSATGWWVTVPRDGSVVRVAPDGAITTVPEVFAAGGDPRPAATPDGVALLDPGDGTVTMIGGDDLDVRRHTTGLRDRLASVVSFHVDPDATYAVVGTAEDSLLAVARLDGSASVRSVKVGQPGAAVLLDDRVYVSDDARGALSVVSVHPNVSLEATIDVAHRPTALEVFANGSMIWANDPNGPNALAIYAGERWPVTKYTTASGSPSSTAASSPPAPPPSSRPPTTRSATPSPTHPRESHGTRGPSGTSRRPGTSPPTTGTTTQGPSNRASVSSPGNGAQVSRCATVRGRADLAPTMTIMIGHRRTSPADGTYYWNYIDRNGNVPPQWTAQTFFGDEVGHRYELILVVITVDQAERFWNQHAQNDGSFATSTSLPAGARVQARVNVTQTVATCR